MTATRAGDDFEDGSLARAFTHDVTETPPSAPPQLRGAKPFLTAQWRDLAMINFDVPARVLEPLVPAGTVLDQWQGATIISLVGFRLRHVIARDSAEQRLEYEWSASGCWHGLRIRTEGAPAPVAPDSEAEFITEHYWGYTKQRDGGTVEYHVTHPSWRVWSATGAVVHGDLEEMYGRVLGGVLHGPPRSAFVADGSEVTVFSPRRLDLPVNGTL